MNSFKKFSGNELPDTCKFFSSLKDVCIREKDYLKAVDVWNVFKMNTMGDYHDLYLKTGISLLANVFEKFAKRHSKANDKYMECFDSSKENQYITFLDANNLYGWPVSQYLPYSGFKWLNQKEISDFCLNFISENSSIGYILEVDLEYPSELHDLHNDYLLALEKLEISQNMISKYCFNTASKFGIKIDGVNKLVPNLGNKSKYVVH